MNVLELFSGTKSIGKVCDQLGWNSVSVDMLAWQKEGRRTNLYKRENGIRYD